MVEKLFIILYIESYDIQCNGTIYIQMVLRLIYSLLCLCFRSSQLTKQPS